MNRVLYRPCTTDSMVEKNRKTAKTLFQWRLRSRDFGFLFQLPQLPHFHALDLNFYNLVGEQTLQTPNLIRTLVGKQAPKTHNPSIVGKQTPQVLNPNL